MKPILSWNASDCRLGGSALILLMTRTCPDHPGKLDQLTVQPGRHTLPPKVGGDDDPVDIDKRLVAFRWPVEVRVILGCSLIEDDQEFLPTATHRVKRDGTQEITNLGR